MINQILNKIEKLKFEANKVIFHYDGGGSDMSVKVVSMPEFYHWCEQYDKEINESRCHISEWEEGDFDEGELNGRVVAAFDFNLFKEDVLTYEIAQEFLNQKLEI